MSTYPRCGLVRCSDALMESIIRLHWSSRAMNRRTLTAHFRKRMKCSIGEFQLKRKVRMAASMFDGAPETPVRTAASMLGFYDEFHFSRAFKRIMGVSPRDYRRRVSGG